jgi:DNA-directed RNA polymerase specialized sigma24 family protein
MTAPEPISQWIDRLKAGDGEAAQKLWESYFRRLVGLARKRLRGTPRRAADEEDVALSAFKSFWRGAERGRFPRLADRDDLWRLLVVITVRKAIDLAQHEGRRQPADGRVLGESALTGAAESGDEPFLGEFLSREPTPEFAATVAEECRRLLDRLQDAELRAVALWKMEGHTNEEIAAKMGCVPRTVERRLRVIRSLWEQEVAR